MNNCTLNIRGLHDFSRILSLLIRPLKFTQNDLCATSGKNTNSISRKICCVKSGFQILYAVKQFSSQYKFKRQIKARGTHTPNPWFAFPAHAVGELPCGSKPTAPTCVVWSLHLKHSHWQDRFFLYTGFPRSLTDGYAMLMSRSKGKTAVQDCLCLRDMAVRMREVLARPWVGVCVPLALSLNYFQGNFRLWNRIKFNLFFYCISWHFLKKFNRARVSVKSFLVGT